jgi:dTDP-4-dehydrorhamnose 3,5-epimerase
MIFLETELKGAFIIETEKLVDERGFFARSFCVREFEQHGLTPRFVQCNISFNHAKGTLRGMHYQREPFGETKLVRCTRGAIYDVIIDLRIDSPTFKAYFGIRLDEDNRRMLYIPKGVAHGFLTLEDNSEIFYQMSEFYSPQHAAGFRWNDASFGIQWPSKVAVISERDRAYPDFESAIL